METMEGLTIGQRITQLRKQTGMSQEDLAKRMNISRQAVSRWESDASLPDIENLILLSKQFSVTLEELLGIPDNGSSGSPDTGAVLRSLLEEYRVQQKKGIRKGIIAGIVSAALCSLLAAVIIRNRMLETMTDQITGLSSNIGYLQSRIDQMPSLIEEKIAQANAKDREMLVSYQLDVKELDYAGRQVKVGFDGIPARTGGTASFRAMNADLSETYTGEITADPDGRLRGTIIVPYQDDLSYFLTLDEETFSLNSGEGIVYRPVTYTSPSYGLIAYGIQRMEEKKMITLDGNLYYEVSGEHQIPLDPEEITMTYDIYINGKFETSVQAEFDRWIDWMAPQEVPVFTASVPVDSMDGSFSLEFNVTADFKDGRHIELKPDFTLRFDPDGGFVYVERCQ